MKAICIKRTVHGEIIAAFCDKTDTDGMFDIVHVWSGRYRKVKRVKKHIFKERFDDKRTCTKSSGVLYVKLGSNARFAHKKSRNAEIQ